MEALFLLIPISLGILAVIVIALLWSVRSGQFDDLEGPAQRILMDEDQIVSRDGKPVSPAGAVDSDPIDLPKTKK